MPRLMERDELMRMAVNLGSAEEVWSDRVQRKGGLKIGLMKGKWNAPSEEEDLMMDEEIASSFDVDGEF